MKVDYIARSEKWVESFVIRHNLCPFAASPYQNKEILWKVLEIQKGFDNILLKEIASFLGEESSSYQTKFLVIPFLEQFDDFVEVYYLMEDLLENNEKEGMIKFVAFHPESKYEGSEKEDPINYANRSPFPMIQMIKMKDIDALKLNEDSIASILEKNETYLMETGYEKLNENLNELRREN